MMNTMFNSQTTDEQKMHYYGGLLSDKDTLFELRMFSAVRRYIQILWKHTADEVRACRIRLPYGKMSPQGISKSCITIRRCSRPWNALMLRILSTIIVFDIIAART